MPDTGSANHARARGFCHCHQRPGTPTAAHPRFVAEMLGKKSCATPVCAILAWWKTFAQRSGGYKVSDGPGERSMCGNQAAPPRRVWRWKCGPIPVSRGRQSELSATTCARYSGTASAFLRENTLVAPARTLHATYSESVVEEKNCGSAARCARCNEWMCAVVAGAGRPSSPRVTSLKELARIFSARRMSFTRS